MRAPHNPCMMPAPNAGVAGQHQQLNVLLVEDDRADALLVEEIIADAVTNIRLTWSQSIAEAEYEIKRHRPDCVLLDLNLPDASGIEILERIAKQDGTIPVVVLTGVNDDHFGVSA